MYLFIYLFVVSRPVMELSSVTALLTFISSTFLSFAHVCPAARIGAIDPRHKRTCPSPWCAVSPKYDAGSRTQENVLVCDGLRNHTDGLRTLTFDEKA